jgi:1-phosphofructokinase family hexose kinase
MTFRVPGFLAGRTFLAESSDSYAGGKGANVSRALLHLGVSSTVTGIIGVQGRRTYIDILDGERIHHDFMQTRGAVRSNVTVISPGTRETHIRDRGPRLNADIFSQFRIHFQKLIGNALTNNTAENNLSENKRPIIILSGSLPEGLPTGAYGMLLHDAHGNMCQTLLDASGEALKLGLQEKPLFIKPNRHETEEVLGFLPEKERDFLKAIECFHDHGVKLVMLSRGREGLYLSNGNSIVAAKVSVEGVISSVGSGDAAVAGAVYSLMHDIGLEETARLSCALGAANTLVPGACVFETGHLHKLLTDVEVNAL